MELPGGSLSYRRDLGDHGKYNLKTGTTVRGGGVPRVFLSRSTMCKGEGSENLRVSRSDLP